MATHGRDVYEAHTVNYFQDPICFLLGYMFLHLPPLPIGISRVVLQTHKGTPEAANTPTTPRFLMTPVLRAD